MAAWLAFLLPDPATPGSIPTAFPKIFQKKKLLMLPRLINGAAKKKVDHGMKMLMELIKYLLVAS